MRPRVPIAAVAFALVALAAHATDGPAKVAVLRAESYGTVLDVLLRVQLPPGSATDLTPDDFAVFIAPGKLSPTSAAAPAYRVARIFLKRLGDAFYIDLRQLPTGVGAEACQLILRVGRGDRVLLVHRLASFLESSPEELDVALLIDESLSMRRTDSEKLRLEAAKTFVDLARRSTRIGRVTVIGFDHKARILAPLTSPAQTDVLYKAIERIRAFGQTDMDGALDMARTAFGESDASARAVVLLTDGKDEPGRYRDAHRAFAEKHWSVYTVGLSKRADTEVLQRIAHDTGGEYHEAPTNTELQDIFGRICLTLQKKVPIRSRELRLVPNAPVDDPLPVDDTISAMTISLKASQPDVAFALRHPKGTVLTPDLPKDQRGISYDRKAAYQYYDLWSPTPGAWAARVQAPQPTRATLSATAVTPLLLRTYPLKTAYYRGEPIEIAASLAYGNSILADTRVEARVLPPDGRPVTVSLHDDGQHQDTRPNDGVFAGFFPGSETPGRCTIRLLASGTTPRGNRFEREVLLTTTISPEGYSRLWCSARVLDLGTAYLGEDAETAFDLKLTSAVPTRAAENVQVELTPPSAGPAGSIPLAAVSLEPSPMRLETGVVRSARLRLTVPQDQAAGRYRGQLKLASKYDDAALPIELEVRRPKLVLGSQRIDLGAIESGSRAEAALALRLEPRGTLPAKLSSTDSRVAVAPATLGLSPKNATIRLTLSAPADHPTASIAAKLVVETPLARTELPVTARVVLPSFAVTPKELDFGELVPLASAERTLTLRIEGLKPRDAALEAASATAPPGASLLVLDAPKAATLDPGKDTPVALTLRASPVQPPGTYGGRILVRTRLGEQAVPWTARVPATATFRVTQALDFGRVAVGTMKALTVEVASLAAAEQSIEVSLPAPAGDWRLAAEPASVTLPPRGKAPMTFRLTSTAAAKPGPREAAAKLSGPSQGAALNIRALLFRPPHQSIAFEPPELRVGRLQAGVRERATLRLRSLVDEPQTVTLTKLEAPPDVVRTTPSAREWTVPASGSVELELVLEPVERADEAPFAIAMEARGRSLPTAATIRGSVFTPPGTTFALPQPVLEFGALERGGQAVLPLTIESLYHREQRVSLGATPSADGLELAPEAGGAILPPGILHEMNVAVGVASDAPLGEHRLTWELRGPGEPASFHVHLRVVPVPEPSPAVAGTEPGGIGWEEGLALFLLFILLLAALVLAFLLIRWLVRSERVPRMAKYFAISALVHAVLLFTALDLFLAHKARNKELVPMFRVGLKSLAPSSFSSQQASAADEIRARQEREQQLDALRQKQAAADLARRLLETERRAVDPMQARLERPEVEQKPALEVKTPDTEKLTVEDLAKVIEEIREAERTSETAEHESPTAATLEAEQLAKARAMSREQLEAIVRERLEPKPGAASREAPSTPNVPGLATPQLAERAAMAAEELVPALEQLKDEMGRQPASGGAAKKALGAQQVGVAEAQHAAAHERATGAGQRRPVAEARSPAGAGRPAAGSPAASPAVAAVEMPRAASKAAAPAFDMPAELAPPVDTPVQQPAEATGGAGGQLASRAVGAGRTEVPVHTERSTGGGVRVELPEARPSAEGGAPASLQAPAASLAQPLERPATGPQAPPITFGVPDEAPAVDELVSVPGAAAPAQTLVEPAPVPVMRVPGGGASAARGTGRAVLPASPGPRQATPGSAPAVRSGSRAALPAAPVGPAAPKAAPSLEDFELVEGPLVEVRRAASQGTAQLGPRTVVARWRLQRRGGNGTRAALAAAMPSSGLTPRGSAVGRPSAGAPIGDIEAPGGRPQDAPDLAVTPQETVAVGPRASAAGGTAESARPASASRVGARVAARGRGFQPAVARGSHGARAAAPVRPRTGSPTALPGERTVAGVRRAPALPDAAPEESIGSARRVAERATGTGLQERTLATARRGGPLENQPREAPRVERRTVVPRPTPLGRSHGLASARLLLPGLARETGDAGVLVGGQTGGAKSIVLTTIKYGSGEVDWDTHKTTMPFLAWQLRERVGFNIDTKIQEVPLESDKILRSPWLYMSGHRNFRFTREQVASLRRYLLAGGTLWADDSTHEKDVTWDTAFRREIARVLPPREDHRLRRITQADDHPIFRSCFDLSKGYNGYFPPPGDKYRQSFIEGIEIDGRLAVVYTRNDYGDGLEIQPDTFPIKASLSGLSPAEMQESSFMMATNVILYILTAGKGMTDRGLVARAAHSLRRHHEARRDRPDPYERAPASVFDDFSEELWGVQDDWDGAGKATLRFARHADPATPGRRMAVAFRVGPDDLKIALLREVPDEADLTGQGRCYIDLESRLDGGARLSIALTTMPDWKYYESRPAFLKPGRNRVHFDLQQATWKTGDPVPDGQSEYCRRPENLDAVRRVVLLLYPIQSQGTIVLDRIEWRAKP